MKNKEYITVPSSFLLTLCCPLPISRQTESAVSDSEESVDLSGQSDHWSVSGVAELDSHFHFPLQLSYFQSSQSSQ